MGMDPDRDHGIVLDSEGSEEEVAAVLCDMHGGDGAIGSNSHTNTPIGLVDGGVG